MNYTNRNRPSRAVLLVTAVAALGYFVDVFDLLLFSVVRKASLLDLGVPETETLSVGLRLLNWQMAGLLIGGFFWGILGDKRGRLSVLFGSILIYSMANLGNGFVHSVGAYELFRFAAGFGLAGELGAGIAIVSEILPVKQRGIGTMIVATIGLMGAVAASWMGLHYDWRTCYITGGVMGLILLVLRIGANESGMFRAMAEQSVHKGSLRMLFDNRERFLRFAKCVLVGLPTYFIVGLLITGAPEFSSAVGLNPPAVAGTAVMLCYAGMALGDIGCSTLSQLLRSRRKAFVVFHLIAAIGIGFYLFHQPATSVEYYGLCFVVGVGCGFWALLTTNAAEQFGTNLRATVTTCTPNLVRAALIPIAAIFTMLKPHFGLIPSAAVVGGTCVAIAIIAALRSEETFTRDLDFVET